MRTDDPGTFVIRRRPIRTAIALISTLSLAAVAVAASVWLVSGKASAARGEGTRFAVDPSWPKPLPHNWLIGQVAGIAVDSRDHIWINQRPRSLTDDERGAQLVPQRSECCYEAPSVMEFDPQGNLIQAWGGPADTNPNSKFVATCTAAAGCQWPVNEHGIFVDHNDYVWVAGQAGGDNQVLKFARDGTFIGQIGHAGTPGTDSSTDQLNRPADIEVDPATNEVYISDGYGNHRVIVFDADTLQYKRHWGANGLPPDPNSTVLQYRNPVHCVRIADDGRIYVCDRVNNRIQVFQKGVGNVVPTFIGDYVVAPGTLGNGATWDVDLSVDPTQTFLYNADGENNHVWTLLRSNGQILSTFGRNGRSAGQFHWVHNLAVDSRGNIYTAEVDTGKRAQKFVNVGLARP
jgi:hypothetical protein